MGKKPNTTIPAASIKRQLKNYSSGYSVASKAVGATAIIIRTTLEYIAAHCVSILKNQSIKTIKFDVIDNALFDLEYQNDSEMFLAIAKAPLIRCFKSKVDRLIKENDDTVRMSADAETALHLFINTLVRNIAFKSLYIMSRENKKTIQEDHAKIVHRDILMRGMFNVPSH